MKKPVCVSQIDGKNVIAKYASMALAEEMTNASSAHISKVVRGIRNTAGGYKWKRTSKVNSISSKNPGINMLDEYGNVIASFADVNVASSITEIPVHRINAVLDGKHKTAGGYHWAVA